MGSRNFLSPVHEIKVDSDIDSHHNCNQYPVLFSAQYCARPIALCMSYEYVGKHSLPRDKVLTTCACSIWLYILCVRV